MAGHSIYGGSPWANAPAEDGNDSVAHLRERQREKAKHISTLARMERDARTTVGGSTRAATLAEDIRREQEEMTNLRTAETEACRRDGTRLRPL